MGMFLNPSAPAAAYKKMSASRFFVDKSRLLAELVQSMDDNQKYICITRPRRFGKTVMANMVGAFFGKGSGCGDLFRDLEISKSEACMRHLNQHDIIYIDFSRMSKDCQNYSEYMERVQDGLYQELAESWPALKLKASTALWDNFQKIYDASGHSFIFILDEWDAIFHLPFATEQEKGKYLLFL